MISVPKATQETSIEFCDVPLRVVTDGLDSADLPRIEAVFPEGSEIDITALLSLAQLSVLQHQIKERWADESHQSAMDDAAAAYDYRQRLAAA